MKSIKNQVLTRIKRARRGRAYCARDFALGTSQRAINQSLHRLAEEGEVRRVAQGVYERPKIHPRFGLLAPNLEEVARALLRKVEGRAAKLQPSGAAAANALGLSQQVPARVVYLTTGRSRRVAVEAGGWRQEIEFRHVEPGQLIEPGTTAGSLFQAVRFLKEEGLAPERISALEKRLPESERRELARSLSLFPVWAQTAIANAFAPNELRTPAG